MMRYLSLFGVMVVSMAVSAERQVAAAPSTSTFMNVMTVCAAGSTIRIDSNIQGSLKTVYEGEVTKGRLIQEIIPEIAKILPKGDIYEKYLGCVSNLLVEKK